MKAGALKRYITHNLLIDNNIFSRDGMLFFVSDYYATVSCDNYPLKQSHVIFFPKKNVSKAMYYMSALNPFPCAEKKNYK